MRSFAPTNMKALAPVALAAAAVASTRALPSPTSNAAVVPRGGGGRGDDAPTNEPPKRRKKKTTNEKPAETKKEPSTPAIVEEILGHGDDYYLILGLDESATSRQIKKAYRKRAVQTHPDKTDGDRRAFDRVSEAHDVLSDERKRGIYDRFGKRGLRDADAGGAAAPPGNYQDFFSDMFHQRRQQQQQQRAPQNPNTRYQIQVSLEDLYKGTTRDIRISSPLRNGSTKSVRVHVPKGALDGQTLVLSGEIDFERDAHPGDLLLRIVQAPHRKFTRRGHDLAVELTISLKESICGLHPNRIIAHLDGRMIKMTSPPDTTIQTGDLHVIKGQGMPKRDAPGEFGDLYVQYKVKHPSAAQSKLTTDERNDLYRLLSKLEGSEIAGAPAIADENDRDRFPLAVASPRDFGRASGTPVVEEEEPQNPFEQFGFGGGRGFFYGNMSGDAGGGGAPECRQM